MFIIDLHYTAPLDRLDMHMAEHVRFLKKYYTQNIFLASGRKVPRTGGIILAIASDQSVLDTIMAEDPFCKLGLATITITEFKTAQTHPTMKILLEGLTDK